MAKDSPGQVYADLLSAGFAPAKAAVMTAVAGAESGWDDAQRGDLALQDNEWGPSFGLYQIRTLKRDTGTGSDRDITWLAASDANQAKAAYDISRAGADFTPWTDYVNGAYQKFLSAVRGDAPLSAQTANSPLGVSGFVNSARKLTIEALFVTLGLGLIAAGAYQAVQAVKR